MTNQTGRNQVGLDEAIAAVRDDVPEAEVTARAAGRVWPQVAAEAAGTTAVVETIGGCDDVRALLPAHRRGELARERAWLVEDHLRDCGACRAAWLRPGERRLALLPWRPASAEAPARPRAAAPAPAYAAAAAVMVATAAAWGAYEVFFSVPPGSRFAVQSVTGALQRVSEDRAVALAPSEEVGEGEPVRTGRGSRAVLRLSDGSLVEMGERAELAVTARGADTTIRLARGSVIVRAAKRGRGHLRVASGDCTVSVTGTIFSVNHGLKGSRVSVLEGGVRVAAAGAELSVAPGEQWTSGAAVERVPLAEEVAWSGEADRHLAMLAELKVLRDRWKAVPTPGLRYESALLPILPAGTVLFASVPNYGESLAEAHRLFEERLQESALLREWWERADPARHGGPALRTIVEKVRTFADYLGDEIVLAVVNRSSGLRPVPIVLARVTRPGLAAFLAGEAEALAAPDKGAPPVRIVEDAAALPADGAPKPEMLVLIHGGFMAVGLEGAALRELASRFDGGTTGGLEASPFGRRLAQAYQEGAGVLVAADLARIREAAASRGTSEDARQAVLLERSGIDRLRHLVVERKTVGAEAHTQAVLSFEGPARGLPSWLAAPGPMGSLEFVSSGAQAAAAFVVKSPALILDDVLAVVGDGGSSELARVESHLDVRLREDVAETLGGEFALALDGPLLPTPSWKVVVEVYDPARLQASLQALVARAADEAAREGHPGLRLTAEEAGGETYYTVHTPGALEVHYAYRGGYLVAAPSRALVMKALRVRDDGDTLGRSAGFRALFPAEGGVNVSGVVYQNVARLLGSLAEAPIPSLTDEQRRTVETLTRDARPTLLCAYGEPDGIRVAGLGGAFDFDMSDLALPALLQRLRPGTPPVATP